MIRAFGGIQTVGAAAQPVFGTTITAVGGFAPDQFTGKIGPGNNDVISSYTVNSVIGFLKGDRVVLGTGSKFVTPAVIGDLGNGTIIGIDTTNKILTIQGLVKQFAVNDFVVLAEVAQAVYITPRITTGLTYIGTDETVASTDPSVFDVIPIFAGTGVPYVGRYESGMNGNPFNLNQFWLKGTNTDTFFARFQQVG